MTSLWSVRMRAEGLRGEHISGAECLCTRAEVDTAVAAYIARALTHPKGAPSSIYLTVERIKSNPRDVPCLDVFTVDTRTPSEAARFVRSALSALGVSRVAIGEAMRVVRGRFAMRGAALVDAATGRRLERDKARGVRVSRMGVAGDALKTMRSRLSRRKLNTDTVREALTLASKAMSAPGVIAELCVSDDLDYTTGYLAVRGAGYFRLTGIKRIGSRSGGRALFIESGADISKLAGYLEQTPVLISAPPRAHSPCRADQALSALRVSRKT